jgi:hypothetical protein
MASSKLSENLMGREVERLFGKISAKRGDLCTNPVTGGEFVYSALSTPWIVIMASLSGRRTVSSEY